MSSYEPTVLAEELYRTLYPNASVVSPPVGYTLPEAGFHDYYADFAPSDVNLETTLGPITLPVPILGAAMDTVSGPCLAGALSSLGGCAIIYRHHLASTQLTWIKEALATKPGFLVNPKSVKTGDFLAAVEHVYKNDGFSVVPVLTENRKLAGIVFSRSIAFADREGTLVEDNMMPFAELKRVTLDTPFEEIRARLLGEHDCKVLPVVDQDNTFLGMYFMDDVRSLNQAQHQGKPLVGMAIGVHKEDLDRVVEGLLLGVGIVVIDSSHGNCEAVTSQARRVVEICQNKAAVIAGNVANIDGYLRLAETGVDAVKAGIGSGSICTTSQVTGVGVPMWTLLQELSHAHRYLQETELHAPAIIADGGIGGPGLAVRALAAGAQAVMAGEWLAAAEEAGSPEIEDPHGIFDGVRYNRYRGMASHSAINARLADRYGGGKTAPEGVEGWVKVRGPLNRWLPQDLELMRGGFAHLGAKTLDILHQRGKNPRTWRIFTGVGQSQMATRVMI
jgi:IMP dehydrogenase